MAVNNDYGQLGIALWIEIKTKYLMTFISDVDISVCHKCLAKYYSYGMISDS
jgi:hypothetical protein